MRAYQITKWKAGAELRDVPVPEPGPQQVLLKVAGNGLCQSDLHAMYEWEGPPAHLRVKLPLTIGHEVAGWIEALGPGVEGFDIGQPVLVTIAGCERCHMCAQGWNNYCLNRGPQVGMGMDGGLAEYVVAMSNGLVALQTIEPWKAAPLTDAGLSAYHALRMALPLMTPDATVFVVGVGGLGHMAVEIIKHLTAARVICADPSEAARRLAAERGADLCLPSDDTTVKKVLEEVGPRRVDVVLDFVGMDVTMKMATRVVRSLGKIVVAGRGHGALEFAHDVMPHGASISTTFGGSKLELMHLIALAEAGKLQSRVTRYRLSDVQSAVDDLHAGKIVGRAVVVPDVLTNESA